MIRVRFHGRGGQGAKVASRVLGTAAFYENYYAQDCPLYGAERRGAPIAAFTRISREPILERGVITYPDLVIVMDETLLRDPLAIPLSGLEKRGIVFINTSCDSSKVKAQYEITAQVIVLDLTKTGLDMLGKPILSALAGGVASRIIGLKEDSLKQSVEKEISEITADRDIIQKNIEASLCCFHEIRPIKINTADSVCERNYMCDVPFEAAKISSPAIYATGNTRMRNTGNWRVFKPVWDYDICTKCMVCVNRCPDGCILVNEEGFPYADYENCKGCLICVEECPVNAIASVREVHAW
ncbi:MAG: 2-oxoacid:acceptor oxidoreductase family protein [Candidatus Brocadiaceae bacterium]|nr:2-oxoacid:acceptor oxidoreductase family protein [Candidatus Brocadiaceae bacterium]